MSHVNGSFDISTENFDRVFKTNYATSKAAIVNFTKGLGSNLVDKGIRANSVAPGPVWTPLIPADTGDLP